MIQDHYRARIARKEVESAKKRNRLQDLENEGAVSIQCRWRQRVAQKKLNTLRREKTEREESENKEESEPDDTNEAQPLEQLFPVGCRVITHSLSSDAFNNQFAIVLDHVDTDPPRIRIEFEDADLSSEPKNLKPDNLKRESKAKEESQEKEHDDTEQDQSLETLFPVQERDMHNTFVTIFSCLNV